MRNFKFCSCTRIFHSEIRHSFISPGKIEHFWPLRKHLGVWTGCKSAGYWTWRLAVPQNWPVAILCSTPLSHFPHYDAYPATCAHPPLFFRMMPTEREAYWTTARRTACGATATSNACTFAYPLLIYTYLIRSNKGYYWIDWLVILLYLLVELIS